MSDPAASDPILTVSDVTLAYGDNVALNNVSLSLRRGEGSVAIVGESGSGKTSLARAVLGLLPPRHGTIEVGGIDINQSRGRAARTWRRRIQPVFQDGQEALDPRRTVGSTLTEALRMADTPRQRCGDRIEELLTEVDLPAELARRRPHELSGGQRQRVAIARALAASPDLLVLDEPTSALDVTVQARIVALLERVAEAQQIQLLLITHNIALAQVLTNRVVVLFRGNEVESGPTADILRMPRHPYTHRLVSSTPRMWAPLPSLSPSAPAAADTAGCSYRSRCDRADPACHSVPPLLGSPAVACHHPLVQRPPAQPTRFEQALPANGA
ncbi:ABC transporter ATP-binding protein [Nocardioides kongjuensis]|uniref:Peptide/nickel transport system ATP-binding protein n=1 Tax=Nocardioides kongjuensis TaxID=349522 RepID=A0A852RP46_9ACTN|nr:ABC transporter ATP-binding protein [Nocardioides kongjuensis]NYD32775.1 peptide/nickel transport system ATP-binding protein [Nocardioides kongjuensis]